MTVKDLRELLEGVDGSLPINAQVYCTKCGSVRDFYDNSEIEASVEGDRVVIYADGR